MSEHTPGPWLPFISETGGFAIEDSNRSRILCQRADWPHRAQESRANARLIAAAPELLAALKAYLVAKPQCECSDHSGCPMASARVLARAAIAKAEGAA
jgi:hypothetical protein